MLLSIRPKYIDEIINGTKKFEFRKKIPNFNEEISTRIILYCSKPRMEIMGSMELRDYYSGDFEEIMRIVGADDSYRERIGNYFDNKEICHAIKIDGFTVYKHSIPLRQLRELDKNFCPGQSYRYLSSESNIMKELVSLNKTL